MSFLINTLKYTNAHHLIYKDKKNYVNLKEDLTVKHQ